MRKSIAFALAFTLAGGVAAVATPALAAKKQGPGKPTPDRTADHCKDLEGDKLEGCKTIGAYLDLAKLQKWAEVKKLTHPLALENIATVKKNLGEERHKMAPWYWAKEVYILKDWKVESVETAANGTVVLNVLEDTYRVEEDGFAEAEAASYLAGKYKGKWYVADRRGGGGGFDDNSVKVGLKGWFEEKPGADKSADAQ